MREFLRNPFNYLYPTLPDGEPLIAMKLVFKSPAKINLGLHILSKRPDGYHELETLFQMVSLYDQIELELLPKGIEIECDMPGIPVDDSNLAVKAAKLVQEAWPKQAKGVRIRLSKKIPAGAGLAGGSGNAAGVLMGLNVLWDLGVGRKELIPLANRLGSDIAFFLTAPCALGRGRGEILEAIETTKKFAVILVYPGFPVSTPWVYQNLNFELTKKPKNISISKQFLSQSKIRLLGERLYNDLEPVVVKRYPEIQVIKAKLMAQGADGVLLSGSGSTVFALFEDPERASAVDIGQGNGKQFLTETITSFSEFLPGEILDRL
jgi:4-diphosphocytidyl-2-C-methyl-D-erythritol kinase